MNGINYCRSEAFDMLEIKTCSNDLHSFKDHLHQELSVGIIEKGATVLNVNGKDYYIKEREAVIIFPYITHKCQPLDINNWAFTMIYIDKAFYKDIIDCSDMNHSIEIKKLGDDEFYKIKRLVHILRSKSDQFSKETELTATILELFWSCDIDIKFQKDERITAIKSYIEEHFLETFQLKELEERFNMNKFAMIRNFRKEFNTTPNAYQLQLKIDYGKQLLKANHDIADIALKAGFYDQAHFTKEFKKAYGITPLLYYKDIH